jgi:hypothetical protein
MSGQGVVEAFEWLSNALIGTGPPEPEMKKVI